MEFLVRWQLAIPPELEGAELEAMMAEERRRGEILRTSGRLLRLWRVPGTRASIGLYNFADATELHAAFSTLPLFPYMSGVTVEPLATHPAEADTLLPAGDGRSAAPA